MSSKKRKPRVTYRFKPCNCGCQGADPWHQASYRRHVFDIRCESGTVQTRDLGRMDYKRAGFVRLPMSSQPVRVVDVNQYSDDPHWVVDCDALSFDK